MGHFVCYNEDGKNNGRRKRIGSHKKIHTGSRVRPARFSVRKRTPEDPPAGLTEKNKEGTNVKDKILELKEEVKKGSIPAAFSLAEAFKWGYYGSSDPLRAARMYRICCRSKDKKMASEGYLNLGVLYYYGYLSDGQDPERDARRAFACFLKSAMTYPNRAALSRLGDMYRYGQYVEKNERVAGRLYLKANA